MQDLWRLSAAQLAQGYLHTAFTPLEALEACLARVDAWQPHTNAFVMIDAAGARAAAQASGRRWAAGQPLGPLDGIPISLKDNLHAAGWPTTWGSRLLQGFVAPCDELPVARLRTAGAVLLGKTNLPEFAMQGTSSNLVYGSTRNPWNTNLTPGGSSGGAVAAVAGGCGPLALATDGGGSIRRPASHTGLVGFKPSAGLVPRGGGLPDIFLDYEVAGPIGRTVQDIVLMTGVLTGTAPDLAGNTPEAARILYVPRFGAHPVDPGIAIQTQAAAARLQGLGHHVQEAGAFDLAEDVNGLWSRLSAAGLAWLLAQADRHPEFRLQAGARPDTRQCSEATQAVLRDGQAAGAPALFELLQAIRVLQGRLDQLFEQHDVLLTPATAALPWPVAQSQPARIDGQAVGPRGHAVFTAFANAAGLPAIALPAASVNGLPCGVQLVGRPGADAALLALALQYEQSQPTARAWPALPA